MGKDRRMGPHILITGAVGAGKSTLIRRLLAECTLSVVGFRTWASAADENGWRTFYISPAGEADPVGTEENRIGRANGHEKESFPETFDRLGPALLAARKGNVIVMDELGSMEEDAAVFRAAVTACLDGEIPVIGAVKVRRDLPFPAKVRTHPRVRLIEIDGTEREAAYQQLLPEIQRWNREGSHASV